MKKTAMFLFCCALLLFSGGLEAQQNMVSVQGGAYTPLYGNDSLPVTVLPFLMDTHPVTNAQYLAFVQTNPKWQRANAKRLFADGQYLSLWEGNLTLGTLAPPNAPVVGVSWFAAKAYCQCQGKRLPNIDEWEMAAMADELEKDARTNGVFNQRILEWYEKPTKHPLPDVGATFKNTWGIWDLHGLVWEWTLDFNSVLISGESRKDGDIDRKLFCSGGAIGATDLMDYAAFLRYAFRGSLKASYTVKNLGFRCVKQKDKNHE